MQESLKNTTARLDHRTQWLSIFSLRLTGYVLLALSAFDVAAIVFPPDFFNPYWEFNTLGKLVERVPVPLIGLSLVFYGGLRYRRAFEKFCLRPFALIAVVVGIGYLLLIPLGISDSIRLQHSDQARQSLQEDQQRTRYRKLEQQITNASPNKVVPLAVRWQLVPLENEQGDPETVRTTALSQLKKNQLAQQKQSLADRQARRQQHLKNSVKWVTGALLAGTCLIYIRHWC